MIDFGIQWHDLGSRVYWESVRFALYTGTGAIRGWEGRAMVEVPCTSEDHPLIHCVALWIFVDLGRVCLCDGTCALCMFMHSYVHTELAAYIELAVPNHTLFIM